MKTALPNPACRPPHYLKPGLAFEILATSFPCPANHPHSSKGRCASYLNSLIAVQGAAGPTPESTGVDINHQKHVFYIAEDHMSCQQKDIGHSINAVILIVFDARFHICLGNRRITWNQSPGPQSQSLVQSCSHSPNCVEMIVCVCVCVCVFVPFFPPFSFNEVKFVLATFIQGCTDNPFTLFSLDRKDVSVMHNSTNYFPARNNSVTTGVMAHHYSDLLPLAPLFIQQNHTYASVFLGTTGFSSI